MATKTFELKVKTKDKLKYTHEDVTSWEVTPEFVLIYRLDKVLHIVHNKEEVVMVWRS